MVGNNTISQCIKGDQQAYSVLYRSCAPYVFTIIKNYFTPDDDRKDAMQEVFAQIFLSIDKFDEEKGSFKAWISKIAVYQSIAILRKKDKIQIGFGLEVVDEENYDTLDSLEKLSVNDLEKMLVNMPVGYKTIFLLSVIDEYSHKEIGEPLGITPETSRSQLFRAIKWIKTNIFNDINKMRYGILQ